MNCAEIENLVCDYVDGTLAAGARAEVERHLAACPACAETVRDSATAIQFMERAATVQPPPELISGLLFQSPWRRYKSGWLWQPINTLLRPKFALSMALTILSLAMVMPKLLKVRQLQPQDLAPAQVWAGIEDQAYRLWARTQKFYDNLKFVYQIQSTLREWQQQSEEPAPETGAPGRKGPEPRLPERALPQPPPAGKS